MNLWKTIKDSAVQKRMEEEAYYAQAADEISRGVKRDGLWAKAIASSGDNEALLKAKYISLLVDALRDEAYIAQQSISQTTSTHRPFANAEIKVEKPRPRWRQLARVFLNGFITFGIWLWVGIMVFGGVMLLLGKIK